jgi:hypothetical protein
LVSRLLGESEGVLAIREPRILRDLALSPLEVRARYVISLPKLMSRTFAADETACVKATSFASEIATELVPDGERALFMYAAPRNYVASILAGENSVKELHALANHRAERLQGRGISLPGASNDAERAAAAWACEMTTLEAAAVAMTERQIIWADFDEILRDMSAKLTEITDFFEFETDPQRLEAIVQGPLMQRYSKDPNYEYSPNLRDELISQELRLQGRDIEGSLAMLRSAAEKSPLLARALARAEG